MTRRNEISQGNKFRDCEEKLWADKWLLGSPLVISWTTQIDFTLKPIAALLYVHWNSLETWQATINMACKDNKNITS